jgi:hypothetical protein
MGKPIIEYVSRVDYIQKQTEVESQLKEISLPEDDKLYEKIKSVLNQIETHYIFQNTSYESIRISMRRLHPIMETNFKLILSYKEKYPKLVQNVSLLFSDYWMKIISFYFNLSSNEKNPNYYLAFMYAVTFIPPHLDFLLSLEIDDGLKEYISNIKLACVVFLERMEGYKS